MDKYNNPKIDIKFDYEGYFSSIFIQALCLDGTTKILTNKGYICVRTLYNNPTKYKIASLTDKNKIEYNYPTRIFKVPLFNRKLYRITSISSHQTKSQCIITEDHPILTQKGWKQVINLEENDRLHTEHVLPPKQIREVIIGMMLGDSTIHQNALICCHGEKQTDYARYKIHSRKYR